MDWNDAGYESANIKIEPNQLPLDAMWKTGQIIQERYDKNLDTFTKMGALRKQMKQNSSKEDHSTVDQIFNRYEGILGDISSRGDYHNLGAQINQEATDLFAMSQGLSERKALMDAEKARITRDPNLTDPQRKAALLEHYSKTNNNLSYVKDENQLSGVAVNPYGYAPTVDKHELMQKYYKDMHANIKKVSKKDIVRLNSFGQIAKNDADVVGYGIRTVAGSIESLSSKDIQHYLENAALKDEKLKAEFTTDFEISGLEEDKRAEFMDKKYKGVINPLIREFSEHAKIYNDKTEDFLTPYGKQDGSGTDTNNPNNPANNQFNSPVNPSGKNPDIARLKNIVKNYSLWDHIKFASPPMVSQIPVEGPPLKAQERTDIQFFINGLQKNLKDLATSKNPKDIEQYKKITTPLIDGEESSNFYALFNKLNSKDQQLTKLDRELLTNILNIPKLAVPTAAVSYTLNSAASISKMEQEVPGLREKDGTIDPIKAIEQVQFNWFGFDNKNGIKFNETGEIATSLGGIGNSLIVYIPSLGKHMGLQDYLETQRANLKEKTISFKGVVNPSANIYANPENDGMDLSFLGNGYTMEVGGEEIYVGNPRDVGTYAADIASIAHYTRGFRQPKEVENKTLNKALNVDPRTRVTLSNDGNIVSLSINGNFLGSFQDDNLIGFIMQKRTNSYSQAEMEMLQKQLNN